MATLVRLYIALVCICTLIITLPIALIGVALEAIRDLFILEERL